MPYPNLNPEVKTPLRWYTSEARMNANLRRCKEQGSCEFNLWVPTDAMIPFQFVSATGADYLDGYPDRWQIYDVATDTMVVDLAADLPLLQVVYFGNPDRAYIIYKGDTLSETLPTDALLQARIRTANGDTLYSETFRVMCEPITCYNKLQWSNCGDLGTIHYDGSYANWIWLQPADYPLNPTPTITADPQETRQGRSIEAFQRKENAWTIQLGPIPFYLLDALTEAQVSDTVQYGQPSALDTLESFTVTASWGAEDECYVDTTLTIQVDDATVNTQCCDTFTPACLEPCETVLNLIPYPPPAITYEVGGQYAFLDAQVTREYLGSGGDAYNFGPAVRCNSGIVTLDGGPLYFDHDLQDWAIGVSIASTSNEECTLINVTGTIMPGYFGTLQASADGIVWRDIISGDNAFWVAGYSFTPQDGESRCRLSVGFEDCVIGYSVEEVFCFNVDPTFSEGGLTNSVADIRVQADGAMVVGGNFTAYGATTANRLTRLFATGTLDTDYNTNLGTGCNNVVYAVEMDSSDRAYAGGEFTSVDGNAQGYITRINTDGTVDLTFNIGTGFNDAVGDIKIQGDGKLVVCGRFTSFNGTACGRIARLNTDGTLDATFTTNTGTGFDGETRWISIDSNGTILVSSGFFDRFNGITVRHASGKTIIRLNADGTYNSTLTTGTQLGPSATIAGMTIQGDRNVLVCGNFTDYDGTACSKIIRLSPTGVADTAFITAGGTGLSGSATTIFQTPSGKILVGVLQTTATFDGNDVHRLFRLNADGSFDGTYNIGTGPNGTVSIIRNGLTGRVIGGSFTAVDSYARLRIAGLIA